MTFNPDEGIYPLTVGPFTQYEKPAIGTIPFLQDDGTALVLTGMSAEGKLLPPDGIVVDLTVNVTVPLEGVTEVEWPAEGLDQVGTYQMEVWVGDGANLRYASRRFIFYVYEALDEPTV